MESIQCLWKKGYLPRTLVEEVFEKKKGYKILWPVQLKAIGGGIFEGKSIVISASTASGKTFVGELAAVKSALDGKRTLYLVPLKALADEKYALFREDYSGWFTSCLSTRDHTPSETTARNSKLIIGTYEKIDLLIRSKAPWLKEIKTLIVDEIQMIDDVERGPTLELIITRMKKGNPDLQIVGLSATLHEKSVKEIAGWLEAKPLMERWRPVELVEGKYSLDSEQLHFSDGTIIQWLPDDIRELISTLPKRDALELLDHRVIKEKIAANLTKKYIEEGKKVLIFAPTRKRAEKFASLNFGIPLNAETRELALKVREIAAEPGKTVGKLAKCVEKGTAFHHAGLRAEHRMLIQHGFEKGPLKGVSATPTLSMGVNFPADVVIFLDHVREYPGRGELGIIEYQNMAGRAGRPRLRDKGECYKGYSILLALNKSEEHRVDKYLRSQSQPVFSKVNVSPTLRKILLSLISTERITTREGLLSFLGDTLFGHVFGDQVEIGKRIDEIVDTVLVPCELVKDNNGILDSTELGNAIARVGLDPLSAPTIKAGLEYFKKRGSVSPLEILHLITGTFDYGKFSPISFVPRRLENEYLEMLTKNKNSFLPFITPELEKVRGISILNDWINEDYKIEERHDVYPGDIDRLVELTSWIMESIVKIAKDLGFSNSFVQEMEKMVKRIKYGIREDLLDLFPVYLKTIGRRQARNLYKGGFRTWKDTLRAPLKALYTNGRITRRTARALKMELVEKLEIGPYERSKWNHIVRADEIGQNVELIKGLYESTGDEYSHYVVDTFKTLIAPDAVGRFPQNGNPDVWVKEGNRYFATIECYAPVEHESIGLSKILEAKKGARYSPDHICICTNAERVPAENLPIAKANAITIFHVTGLAELLLSKWENKVNLEFIGRLFEIKGDVINAELVKKLIKSQIETS